MRNFKKLQNDIFLQNVAVTEARPYQKAWEKGWIAAPPLGGAMPLAAASLMHFHRDKERFVDCWRHSAGHLRLVQQMVVPAPSHPHCNGVPKKEWT